MAQGDRPFRDQPGNADGQAHGSSGGLKSTISRFIPEHRA
jgi:hypothetical protein